MVSKKFNSKKTIIAKSISPTTNIIEPINVNIRYDPDDPNSIA